jgi:hypothetical protein
MHCEIQKCKQQLVHLNCDVLNLEKIATLDNICEMDFIFIFIFWLYSLQKDLNDLSITCK